VPEKVKSHAKNTHPRPATGLWHQIWRPAGLFAAVLMLYLPSVRMGWIYDDHIVILAQAPHRSLGEFAHIFAERHFPNLPYYRPITRSTLLLQKSLHGDHPAYFHFGNAILIGLAALLAYFLLHLPAFGVHPDVALFGAAVFALHPVASSCVYPISSGRETLMPALWTLLAVYAFLRSGRYWPLLAWVGFVGALFSKESAVIVPGLFILTDALKLSQAPAGRRWSQWIGRYLPAVLILLAYFAFRQSLFGSSQYQLGSPLGPLYSFLYAIQTFFIPTIQLVYEPSLQVWLSPIKFGVALGLTAALCVIAFRVARPAFWFWSGWFALTLLPTANLLHQEAGYDERYLFLGSLGIVGILSAVATCKWEVYTGFRWVRWAAVTVVALCASVSLHRASYFKDDFAFSWQWLRTDPLSFNAHYNLGLALAREGKMEGAMTQYSEALKITPQHAQARNNLGSALFEIGRVEEAILQFSEALRIDADYADAHFNLGNALAKQRKTEQAIVHFQQAVRLAPGKANFQNNLGNALAAGGSVDEAIGHFKEAVRLQPDYAEAYNNLGVALVSQGKLQEAVGQFNEALRYQANYGDAQRNREIVLLELEKQTREKRQ
jgi:tetratricopeptide (TPR) repeat protein